MFAISCAHQIRLYSAHVQLLGTQLQCNVRWSTKAVRASPSWASCAQHLDHLLV